MERCENDVCGLDKFKKVVQLHDKDKFGKEYPIFPVTYTHAVYDKNGASLESMLAQFNNVFLQYQGTAKDTRLLLPKDMRRKGIQITYRNMDDEVVTEKCVNDSQRDNDHWGLDANWTRIDELSLQGDISVSKSGTWIINGADTGVKALGPKGDNGLTPWMKTIDNKLYYSYDNKTWELASDYIAAWFRFTGTSGSSQAGNIGKIQISRDEGNTWADLSGEFTNNLHIKGYVATTSDLPSSAVQGDIYGVGPTYAESDTEHTNPIYRLHVKDGSGWVDNGQFTGITVGVVQELGDSETEVINQKGISISQTLQLFNGNSVFSQNELGISQCIKLLVLEDFDTENISESWKLLSFGFLTSSSIIVFYLQRVSDGKMVEYEPEHSENRTGVQCYDTYVNNLHIKLYFDWSIYNKLFAERYIPTGENKLLINAIKGTSTEITQKGFYTTNGNTIRNDNIQISRCFSNFKLYEYMYDGGSYEFYQQGWLPSVGHPIFYYKKIGTEDVIQFDDTSTTEKPIGIKHHLYDNGVIRVEFDFDWDLFFMYFPTDCYRRRENNYLTVNSLDFSYAYKIDSAVKSIEQLSIKQDREYIEVTEFYRNKYVIYNKPVPKTSLLKTLVISVSRSSWTTTPELVKLNLVIGTFDQRNTLVNPRVFTYLLSELNIKYPSSLYVEIDLSDKNIEVGENEVIGVRSGSTATNDFIFLVSRGTDLSNDVFIATEIEDTFASSYQFVKFEATFSVIDSIFSTKESVDKLGRELTTLSNSLAPTIANILTDDATGVKYKLKVTNGILNVKSLNYNRLLIIGTSQVNPQAEPAYGWFVNRTMAASVDGHALADYILKGVKKRTSNAVMSLMNDYLWQRNFDNFDYSQYDTTITAANPDAIYLVTGGNSTYSSTFGKSFGEYLDYLKRIAPNAEIYVLVGWYGTTKANDMISECINRNISYVNINYNRNKYNTWAVGDYYLGDDANTYYPITNTAVGSHPNDMGHFDNAEELLKLSYQESNDDLKHNIILNVTNVTAEVINSQWIKDGIVTIRIKSGVVNSIMVKDSENTDIAVVKRNNDYNSDYNTYYTFVMPDKNVVVTIS